jgi:capsular polysaccharide biosynthesis protein
MSLIHFKYKLVRLVSVIRYINTNTLSKKIQKVYLKITHPRDLYVLRFRIMLFLINRSKVFSHPAKKLLFFFKDVGRFESLENYAIKQPEKVRYINKYPQSLSYSSPRFFPDNMEDQRLIKLPESIKYVVELRNAYVIGGSNLIMVDRKSTLYEIKYNDPHKKFQYTDEALQCYNDEFCLIKSTGSNTVFDEAISLAGNFSWNYYHLLYEILIKFEQINALNIDLNIPVLVDQICFEVPQYLELLTLLNTRERKLLAVDKGKSYLINRLYIISCPNIIPPHYIKFTDAASRDFLYDLNALSYLRHHLLHFSSHANTSKRIFISRRKASQRRKFNENEVYEALAKLDFSIVFPEDYSIADQIALFNNADIIAGGTGAAFSNLLFCRESCKVICFTNYRLPISLFSTIADFVGIQLLYLADESKEINNIGDIHDPFTINIDCLNEIILGWIQ